MTGTRLALLILGGVVAVLVLAWTFQRRLIYLPDRSEPDVGVHLPGGEQITVAVEDGLVLTSWWMPPKGEPLATVIVFPGNAGNRAGRAPLARALAARGIGTLLVDYRGYGGNPGSPSEGALVSDAVRVVDHIVDRRDVDPDSIFYFGESLGAGVAVATAGQRPPAGLVLRSPFTSLADVAAVHYPWLPTRLLLWDRYTNADTVADLTVPMLVVAGSDDSIVPPAQSRDVYEAISGPKRFLIVDGADHNDFAMLAGDRLITEVVGFITDVSG